jgi:hypothetical protein
MLSLTCKPSPGTPKIPLIFALGARLRPKSVTLCRFWKPPIALPLPVMLLKPSFFLAQNGFPLPNPIALMGPSSEYCNINH